MNYRMMMRFCVNVSSDIKLRASFNLLFQPQVNEPNATCASPTRISACSSPPPRGFTPTFATMFMQQQRRGRTPVSAVSRGVTPTLVSSPTHLSPTLTDARSKTCQRPSTLSPTPSVSCPTSGKMTPDPVSGVTPVLGRKEARYRFSLIVVSAKCLCWNAFDLDLDLHSNFRRECLF